MIPDLRSRADKAALHIPAPCVCVDVPLCDQHKIAAQIIVAVAEAEVARAILSYRNAFKFMEWFLMPEWDEADTEIAESGNSSWTMVATLAIRKRVTAALRAQEPTHE